MFKKFKLVKKLKKVKKRFERKDKDYVTNVKGTYRLCSKIDNEGKVLYNLVLDGEFDGKDVFMGTEEFDRLKLLHLQEQIDELLKKTDPCMNPEFNEELAKAKESKND